MRKKGMSIVETMEFYHEHPPQPFNPDYIPYASDVQTIAVANLHRAGRYQGGRCDPKEIRAEYDRLMKFGKPSQRDVRTAKDYLYEL